jgi:cbb3-type cytochrome oxidase maturation protein
MDILFLLIPMSVLLALLVIVLFAWAIKSGQFEDLGFEGERILEPDVPLAPVPRAVDGDQAAPGPAP